MGRLIFIAIVVGGLWWYFSAEDERWTATVYRNYEVLGRGQDVGVFPSLHECRDAALGTLRAMGWTKGTYECGLNCRSVVAASGDSLLLCDESSQ